MDVTKTIEKVKYGNIEIPLKTLHLQEKTVSPQTNAQVIEPDEAYGGLKKVNVEAVTSDIDNNIQASNIKLGVTILGVEGNLETDKPDQNKTVTPTEQTQEVMPDTGYELAKVTVNPIPSKYKDTTNANVTAGDILAGKVAVNGSGEVTGTIETYNGATTVTPTTSQQTLSTDNKYVDDNIVVEAIQTEEKTPTIDFTGVTEVEVTPTSGKYLTKVTVEKPNALTANNIKSGVTVFGIAGNLEPDKPDQTKTVNPTTSQQIVEPDTGYELASVTVNAIQTEQKTVKSTSTSQTITPTSGKFIDEVTVDPIVLQSKTVTPTTSQQTITPDSGNDGLSSVTVDGVTSAIDSNIVPSNIKLGVSILGVAGNVEPDKPDQTKTVNPTTSQQIVTPDTGYELASVTVNAVDPDDYTEPYNEQLIALNSGGGVEPSVMGGVPITATTDNEMSALLVAANDGKVVKFTGTSQTYETDAYYIIEEDSV